MADGNGAIEKIHGGKAGGVSVAYSDYNQSDIKDLHKKELASGNVWDFSKTHPHFA